MESNGSPNLPHAAGLLLLYLRLFAWLASDREHALNEHMLVYWSVEERQGEYLATGVDRGRARARALWDHRAELQPVALVSKTASDQQFAPRGPGSIRRGLLVMAGTLALVLGAATVPVVLAADESPHLVVRASPEGAEAPEGPLQVRGFSRFEDALASVGASPADLEANHATDAHPVATPDAHAVDEPLDHCVVRLGPMSDQTRASDSSEPRCYPTFARALAAATGIEVSLMLDRPRETDEILSALEPIAASAVIGISFSRAWFAGGTLTWVSADRAGCRDGATYAVRELPARWDASIASALALGGCETFAHFERVDHGGAQLNCTCDGMRAMHRQTSSLGWSR